MIPGMNPRQMRDAMKRMGIAQEEIPAEAVVIHTKDKEIIIRSPSVLKVKMMGSESFQISGTIEEKEKSAPPLSNDDVRMVMEQAGVSEQTAREALATAEGDIAQAILSLQG